MSEYKNRFPECFPDNFYSEILPSNLPDEEYNVYRVSKNGNTDNNAFISTYEEYLNGEITDKDIDLDNPSTYSTSCNKSKSRIKGILKLALKHGHPKPIILEGVTKRQCGPSQVSRDRDKFAARGHVDWWIFKNSKPEDSFKIWMGDEESEEV